MAKGVKGKSCAEAIRESISRGEVLTFFELFRRVREKGSWKDETIWQHLMALVVNLPFAKYHWPNKSPFLFLHGDGRYSLYDPQIHPMVQVE